MKGRAIAMRLQHGITVNRATVFNPKHVCKFKKNVNANLMSNTGSVYAITRARDVQAYSVTPRQQNTFTIVAICTITSFQT